MLIALFNFGKAIIRKGMQWFNKKRQQLIKPTDGSAVLETDQFEPQLLADFNPNRPKLIKAPEWATKWARN